ncbi:MAG TPA: hypothetical protein VGQ24_05635, partial [Gemmatimonadales bacterium]|nr:hypothetical protein [Gemmatimonadales bacterium]
RNDSPGRTLTLSAKPSMACSGPGSPSCHPAVPGSAFSAAVVFAPGSCRDERRASGLDLEGARVPEPTLAPGRAIHAADPETIITTASHVHNRCIDHHPR